MPRSSVSDLRSESPLGTVAEQLFTHLSRVVLQDEADPRAAERRLWRLPELATAFVQDASPGDRTWIAPVDSLIDRSAMKQRLAITLDQARREFVLRPWQRSDRERLASLLNSPSLWRYIPEGYPGPVSVDLAQDLIDISNGSPERHFVLAVEWRSQPIGQVRLQFDSSPDNDAAEISYWLGEAYQGQGLATGFVTLFTADAFAHYGNLQRVFARVLDGNVASMRVLDKAGFHAESFQATALANGATTHTHVLAASRAPDF